MKNFILFVGFLFILGSCKVSDNITVDSLANTEMLKGYQTFQLVEADYADKRNERIKLTFRDKLLEYGFEESSENPDFLVQGVVVTRKFIQEISHYSSSIPGPFYSANNSGNKNPSGGTNGWEVNRGMIGKVIFLIQDAKTNEIAWMGVGTGIVHGSKSLNYEDLDIALDELVASL